MSSRSAQFAELATVGADRARVGARGASDDRRRWARADQPARAPRPLAGDLPQGTYALFELGIGETHPKLSRSGNCAPPSPTLRGAQMDLGPPGPSFRFVYAVPGKCRAVQSPHLYRREASRKVGSAISSERCWKTSPPVRGHRPSSPSIAACRLCRDCSHDWSASDSRAGPGSSADGPWMLTAAGRARLPHTDDQGDLYRAYEDYLAARRLGRPVRI